MKGLRWFDKILFVLNSVSAVILLFSYLLPFIPPNVFALLSVLSLTVPLLIVINLLFLFYWLLRLKKQVLLPLVVLLLGFNHLTSIYEISGTEELEMPTGTFSFLSYNVRQFNQYEWSSQKDIPERISEFIKKESPDIVTMQEYYTGEQKIAASFPYKFIKLKEKSAEFGLAILSEYPIIHTGSLNFNSESNNNAIFADIVIQKDTVRVINVHLQSFSVKPNLNNIEKEHSKKVFLGMGRTFVIQQRQVEKVLDLIKDTPYKIIVAGDFNNTAYSYIYRELRAAGFNDAYKEAGSGFGRTFDFNYFPLRIDFILPDISMEVLKYQAFEIPYSDHFPVKAVIKL